MHSVLKRSAAVFLTAACAMVIARPAAAQQVVGSVKSVDALMTDLKQVLIVMGQEQQGAVLDLLVSNFKGIDRTKPVSLAIDLPENPGAGAQPDWIIAVPMTSKDDVLGTLKQFQWEAKSGDGDVYTASNSQGQTGYLKFAKDHFFVAGTAARLRAGLPDPAKLIPAAAGQSLISMELRLDKIPAAYKQFFRAALDQEVEKAAVRNEGETEAQHQGRQFGAKAVRDLFVDVMEEGAELTARLELDSKQSQQIGYDVSLTAKPGTKLAGRIKSFEDARSVFAGLAADAAMSAFVNVPLNDDVRQLVDRVFKDGIKKELEKQEDPNVKAMIERLAKGLGDAVATDALDAALVIRGPLADGKFVLLGAVKTKDGKALDSAVRDVLKQLPEEIKAVVSLDNDKQGDAVIHMVKPGKEPDALGQVLFGTNDFYIGVRQDVVIFALGTNGKEVLKEALTVAGKPAPLIAPSVQFEVSVAKLLPIASAADPAKGAAVAEKLFSGDNKGKDKMRLTLRGGQSLQLRFEMHWQAVKAFIALRQ